MSEADAVERVDEPGTVDSLVAGLRALSVERGDTLLAHSSLSLLGWVTGGPQTVVDAFQVTLTNDGALVMPTHTDQYTDPLVWENPPVPDDWVEITGGSIPPFHPDVTPTHGMGAMPECFRSYPDVVRNEHPTVSFAMWGAAAEGIVGGHELDHDLGDGSLLVRVYDRGDDVLLPSVGHGNNTSLHLAEYRTGFERTWTRECVPLLRDGERVVVEYDNIEVETDDLRAVGEASGRQRGATEGPITATTVTLLDQPTLIDFAEDWFESNH